MCGTRVELGIHSYRTEDEAKKGVYCVSCNQQQDPDAIGTIFSCDNCNEHVCGICGKLSKNKHYCPECYTKLLPKLEKPKKTTTRVKKRGISKKQTKIGKSKVKGRGKGKRKKKIGVTRKNK